MNCKKINILILLIFYVFFISCCREEILTPSRIESINLLNNPIQAVTASSYTFEITAQDNSSYFIDPIPILRNLNLSLSLDNYTSGTVSIFLVNKEQIVVYNRIFGNNLTTSSVNLDGLLPSLIKIEFGNFSGDFSLQLAGKP
jgi:hypothetical protein